MKLEAIGGSVVSHFRRIPYAGFVVLTCVIACSALRARAGNIFDDDWTPPKATGRQHTVPVQPPPIAPVPSPAAPNPAVAPPAEPPPAPELQPRPPLRHPIPGKIDQARSRGLLKEAFAKQLEDRSTAGRKKLAQALLDEVAKTADNAADVYVLLGGAIDASRDAVALTLCFQAADMMGSQYEVDGLSIKAEAVLKVNLHGDSPATTAANVRAALELIDPLLAAEDFHTAMNILGAARTAAARDRALTLIIQKRVQIVENLAAAYDRLAADIEKLKTSPDDPAANLAVGRHLCFDKGEWEKGLPMLAKCSDANLKQLALLELARPTAADDVIRLGDGWWDVAGKQPDAVRVETHQHAASFYKAALPTATGLRRTLMERHVADASVEQSASQKTDAARANSAQAVFINSIGMRFNLIPAGEFTMGSEDSLDDLVKLASSRNLPDYKGEAYRNFLSKCGEWPQHKVRITKPFYMGTTTVTIAQFTEFLRVRKYQTEPETGAKMAVGVFSGKESKMMMQARRLEFNWKNPGFPQAVDHPVVCVSWNDATAFCEWLSKKEGKTYRLPTEAEWEYACRATTQTRYSFGNDQEKLPEFGNSADLTYYKFVAVGNFRAWAGASEDRFIFTAPVGKFKPNGFGLHDMHGNVEQWCMDWFAEDYYSQSPHDDPKGPVGGTRHVLRGGCWLESPLRCRSAAREKFSDIASP